MDLQWMTPSTVGGAHMLRQAVHLVREQVTVQVQGQLDARVAQVRLDGHGMKATGRASYRRGRVDLLEHDERGRATRRATERERTRQHRTVRTPREKPAHLDRTALSRTRWTEQHGRRKTHNQLRDPFHKVLMTF
jgi:hypothetical protein